MVSCQARDSRVEATPEQPLCYLPSRLQSNGAARFCPFFSPSAVKWIGIFLTYSAATPPLLSGQLTAWPVDSRQRIVVQSQDTDNLPSPSCLFNTGYENYSVLGSVTTTNHSTQLQKNWSSLLPCSFLSHYSQQEDLRARKLLIFSSVCSKASLFLLFFIFGISTVLRLINLSSTLITAKSRRGWR